MSTARNPFKRRITAGIGIAALATAALFGSMLPANAADNGNIDTGAAKSLTIHKYAQPATTGTAPDGNELPADATSGLTALKGVEFTIQKVTNIDLNTNAGWAATVGLSPADVDGHLGAAQSKTTGDDGVLTFDGLEQAVYLVTETNPGANNVAFAAQPFLVTLPLPDSTKNSWIYNVHVYPKNSLASITKEVNDSAATGLGDDVTWNIAAKVPNKSADAPLSKFEITDQLDARLTFKSANVTLESGAAIVEGTDFTVDGSTGTVKISFTAAGLDKFAADETVNVALVTTVTTLTGNSGVITNDATVFTNDKDFTSDKAQTNWGKVIIRKTDSADKSKNLQGAKFQVYATEADAKAGSNPISVSGETTFTSNENGIATIAGLKATLNGSTTPITYWLVETEAPTGYTVAGDVSAASPKSFTVGTDIDTNIDIVVENTQTPPFMLPLTGGSGTAMFMIGGLGLLAVAGGVAMRKRSTRRTVQA